MLEAAYRTLNAQVPAPRTPSIPTPTEKGFDKAQPWQCKPWRDAQVIGLEIRWTEAYTMTVRNENGRAVAETDFGSKKKYDCPSIQQFSEGHYGVSTQCQIQLPRGFNLLVLPHMRFFDSIPAGAFNDLPSVIPGVLEADWWPSLFFVVSKLPNPGEDHVYYAGEPFCQVVPVPRSEIAVRPMTGDERSKWIARDTLVTLKKKEIATHNWSAKDTGYAFGNHYKVLSAEVRKHGWNHVMDKYSQKQGQNPDISEPIA